MHAHVACIMEHVPARTIEGDPEQWRRVADYAYRRRADLNLTASEVVERSGGGVSLSLLSMVENAKQTRYQDKKVRSLSRALWGSDDSIELILKGGEPTVGDAEPGLSDDDSTVLARLAELESWRAEWEPLLVHLKEETSLRLLEMGLRREEIHDALKKQAESDAAADSARSLRGRRGA